jgi:DNA-binding transcriptional ArsR family regulator
MLELFAESPKTTKQVAELLGEPPTRLYHHVAALERAGLLTLKEKRQNRGAVEKWYIGIGQQLQSTPRRGKSAAAGRAARRAVAATVLEQAKHELMSMPAGAKEPALITRLVVAAPSSEIPAIRDWLLGTLQKMRSEFQLEEGSISPSTTACERWAVTLAFAPVRSPR